MRSSKLVTSPAAVSRRMTFCLIVVGAAVTLSGCTSLVGGGAQPSATPSVEDVPPSVENIGSRFPDPAEWEADYSATNYCGIGIPDIEECEPFPPGAVERWYSNGYELKDGITEVTAQAVILNVSRFDSAELAEAEVQRVRDEDAQYEGKFDIPAANNDDGLLLAGARGSGEFSKFQNGQWGGFRLEHTSQSVDGSGSTTSDQRASVTVSASQGDLAFLLRIYWADPAPGAAGGEADYWLERALGTE